jgi:hypothetical protein
MRQKYFEEVKPKFEKLNTDELLSIWKENDQDEYTLREIGVAGQILRLRNVEFPAQDVYEEKEDGVYSKEVVASLLKGAQIFLLIFGVVNLVYWYFAGETGREEMLKNFREVKPLLWIEIYGNAVVSVMLIFMSFLCFLQRQNIGILIYSGILLTFSGIWVLFSGFIAIPAYAEYGKTLTVYQVLDGGKYFLFVLGILQIRWGYNQVKDYFKVRKFESDNFASSEYSNTPE